MKRAAFGIRMHSGWGILVAVSDELEMIDRRRITVTTHSGPRGNQPFHHAKDLGLPKAEEYLSEYRLESERIACEAIGAATKELKARGHEIVASAILLASGRPLPALPQILASHPLIHTAEGELFRDVAARACELIGIPVMRYRERALEEIVKSVLAGCSQSVLKELGTSGKKLGPPWTADHKAASLAAYVALHEITTKRRATVSAHGV